MPTLPPGWRLHAVTPSLRLRVVRAMPDLPAALNAEVDRLWVVAQARTGGKLFNGRVFNADTIKHDQLCGHWTEYRRVLAQMDRPDLFDGLAQRPLAVNGIVQGPDGLVFGRRPDEAVYQPGQWQLPPAGCVDDRSARPDGTADMLTAVLAELREELGLASDAVSASQPLALVEHAGSHVLDLGIALRTGLTAGGIRAAHAAAGNAEYAGLEVVALADLVGFLARIANDLTPQALVFLTCLGLLPAARVG
jgi:hypothetical protein